MCGVRGGARVGEWCDNRDPTFRSPCPTHGAHVTPTRAATAFHQQLHSQLPDHFTTEFTSLPLPTAHHPRRFFLPNVRATVRCHGIPPTLRGARAIVVRASKCCVVVMFLDCWTCVLMFCLLRTGLWPVTVWFRRTKK